MKYQVHVTWAYSDIIEIEADSESDAIDKAYDTPVSGGNYVSDSFEVLDVEEIKENN